MMNKQCILFLADGARADVFEFLLEKGDLPNISKYIIERGFYRKAVTVFPSTTGPAYLPYLLGMYPGNCNVPGIRWFDRRYYDNNFLSLKRFRSYIGLETYLLNSDVESNGVPTLFQTFPNSISILNEFTRGIKNGGDKTKFIKVFYKIKSHYTHGTSEVDRTSGDMILNSLEDAPNFIFSVFLGIDTYSHQFHPFHSKVIESYKTVDKYVGIVAEKLIKEGKLDDTLLVVGSDHGLTSTHSHFDSLKFMEAKGYRTFYYPNIFRHFFDADAANMISGNSMAHLYFKSDKGWNIRSTIEELDNISRQLLERPEVDILAGISSEGKIAIRSERGDARTWIDKKGIINYEIISDDPFGYKDLPKKMDSTKSLELSYNTNYPDSIVQINQIFNSPRTGDIVLSAKPGFDLRARHEKPEHHSSHGSLIYDHMFVPLATSVKTVREYIRTVDVYPSILKFLNSDLPEGIDGSSLI